MPVVKIMAEYESHPLWMQTSSGTENVDPHRLPIKPGLAEELLRWADEFDNTLNRADPLASGFADSAAENAFYEHGQDLARRLAADLPEGYGVEYFDGRDVRVIRMA